MPAKKTPKDTPQAVYRKIEALRKELLEHNRLYYDKQNPKISDSEYDALLKKLRDLEAAHPEALTPDSPTQKVGGAVSSSFAPAKHARPMLSLDNTYNE